MKNSWSNIDGRKQTVTDMESSLAEMQEAHRRATDKATKDNATLATRWRELIRKQTAERHALNAEYGINGDYQHSVPIPKDETRELGVLIAAMRAKDQTPTERDDAVTWFRSIAPFVIGIDSCHAVTAKKKRVAGRLVWVFAAFNRRSKAGRYAAVFREEAPGCLGIIALAESADSCLMTAPRTWVRGQPPSTFTTWASHPGEEGLVSAFVAALE